MRADKFKQLTKEAITELLQTDEGEELFGQIVINAVNKALNREMVMVRNRDATRKGEEAVPETVKMTVFDALFIYLPRIEGALRGLQEDSNKTKHSVDETRKVSLTFLDLMQESYRLGVLQPLLEERKLTMVKGGSSDVKRIERSGE